MVGVLDEVDGENFVGDGIGWIGEEVVDFCVYDVFLVECGGGFE